MPRRTFFFLISFSALLALGFTTARANRHHHSVNMSGGHRQPATDCSDLRIRFDDRDAMVRSEERTLTKHEAAVLQVHPHSNGGVQVVGWDQETYAVTACKAASGSGAEAEQILSQIKMSLENGKVSTSGPGDDEEWTVYLLIGFVRPQHPNPTRPCTLSPHRSLGPSPPPALRRCCGDEPATPRLRAWSGCALQNAPWRPGRQSGCADRSNQWRAVGGRRTCSRSGDAGSLERW